MPFDRHISGVPAIKLIQTSIFPVSVTVPSSTPENKQAKKSVSFAATCTLEYCSSDDDDGFVHIELPDIPKHKSNSETNKPDHKNTLPAEHLEKPVETSKKLCTPDKQINSVTHVLSKVFLPAKRTPNGRRSPTKGLLNYQLTTVFLNGTKYTINTNSRITIYSEDGNPITACLDTGSPICLIDVPTLAKRFPSLQVQTMSNGTSLALQGVGNGPQTNKFVLLPVRCKDMDGHFMDFPPVQAHIVERLPEGIVLLGLSWIIPNELDFKWGRYRSAIYRLQISDSGKDIPMRTKSAKQTKTSRPVQVYLTESVTIELGFGMNVPTRHRILPACKNGYVLTPYPQVDIALGKFGSAMNCLIDRSQDYVPFANFGEAPIRLLAGTCIGSMDECSRTPVKDNTPETQQIFFNLGEIIQGLPVSTPKAPVQTEVFLNLTDMGISSMDVSEPEGRHPDGHPFLVRPPPEPEPSLEKADISDHWGEDTVNKIKDMLYKHKDLFRSQLGCFNDGVTMPIPFRQGVEIKDLRQPPYLASRRDRDAIDSILDPMKAKGSLEQVPLGRLSPAASPAFVVWRNGKPRMVMDLRRVNTKLELNAYPLLKQDDILSALGKSTVFTSLDLTKSFFQQKIPLEDRWKVTLVTAYRGLKQLTVALQSLSITPAFF